MNAFQCLTACIQDRFYEVTVDASQSCLSGQVWLSVSQQERTCFGHIADLGLHDVPVGVAARDTATFLQPKLHPALLVAELHAIDSHKVEQHLSMFCCRHSSRQFE